MQYHGVETWSVGRAGGSTSRNGWPGSMLLIAPYLGCKRRAPSNRMTSPFKYLLSQR